MCIRDSDRAVFVTSEGEVLVYAGTNPSSAADWALVGLYKIGRPLGRRCLSKIAGDLLIITQNGVFPMSAAIQSETIDYKLAISFKIENAFNEASNAYGSNFGWKAQLFPTQSALLVNIPITEDEMCIRDSIMSYIAGMLLNKTRTSTEGPEFKLGAIGQAYDGKKYKYVQYVGGAGAIAAVAGNVAYYYAVGGCLLYTSRCV